MKLNRTFAALVFVGLAACSRNENNPAPNFPEIPSDITFDKGGLAPIADSDYQEAMKIWQDFSSAPSIDGQLFTKDEDSETQTQREKQYAEMTDAWRASIDSFRANCTVDEQIDEGTEPVEPKVGDSMIMSNSGSTNGPNCGTTTTLNANTLLTILAQDSTSGESGILLSYAIDSQISSQEDIVALGYSSLRFSGKTEGRQRHSDDQAPERFDHTEAQGETVLANGQTISYTLTIDSLKKSNGDRVFVTRVMFSLDSGSTMIYSNHVRYENGAKIVDEKYFGDRQLSANEVNSLGKFPVPLEDLAAID